VGKRQRPTRWYQRLVALGDVAGDHTQQDIATRLGVSPGAVSAWKRGTLPAIETVLAAARAYGVDEIELIRVVYDLGRGAQGEIPGSDQPS
jgi:transcriptional regulator with XRE-family HTH domain